MGRVKKAIAKIELTIDGFKRYLGMDNQKCIRSLVKLCKLWGGSLELISEDEHSKLKEREDFSEAPFTHADLGVLWAEKRIVYTARVEVQATEIIHEMGHVFADKSAPDDNSESEEIDFLGWEIQVARKVRVPLDVWFQNNKDYIVDIYGGDLGDVEPKDREEVASRYVELSTQKGLLVNEKPIAIR